MQIQKVLKILFLGLAVAQSSAKAESFVSSAISFQGDTVHLELSGQQNWNYDVKRKEIKGKTVVEMFIPALDPGSVENLNKFKSEMVTQVKVDPKGPDGQFILSFWLQDSNIESFDYLTDQPSRLIVDFYENPNIKIKNPPVAKGELSTQPNSQESDAGAVMKNGKAKAAATKSAKDRVPATTDVLTVENQGPTIIQNGEMAHKGIFDGGDPDYSRFSIEKYNINEESIIRSRGNYYINFPMLESPIAIWEKIKTTPSVYDIVPKESEENKQARLLLTLFEKQRYGIFLKTRQWFKEKYPNSVYNEIIDYLTADVHYILAQETGNTKNYEEAIEKYKDAIEKYPDSALSERTSVKIGFLALERGDAMGALRQFKNHIDNKHFGDSKSVSKELARLGMGLAFMKANRWEEAAGQFEDLEKNGKNRDFQVEAAYRKGDIWVKAKKYSKAIEDYQSALKKYPESQDNFPNSFYNQAESLFGMRQYTQSLDRYKDFVKKFPSSDHAPYALTRMGELLDILGADKPRVMGAYLETFFRYGENPTGIVARLRLLSARMKSMKPKEAEHAVTEIMSLAKKSDLPNIEQFASVMVAEGYNQRGEFDKAIDLLSSYYKEHPINVDVPLVSARIISNINGKIQAQVEAGNFIGALKTHKQYLDSWLKNSNRLDTKFNIGKSYELAGVPVQAEKYYKDLLNKIYAIKGTEKEKEIRATENLPSEDLLNLRLASLNLNEQKYNLAYEFLKNIKSPEKLSEGEQIERIDIAFRLLEKRGDFDSALQYLGNILATWKGQPQLIAEPYLKLAELQVKQNKPEEALKSINLIDKLSKDTKNIPAQVHAKALELAGDLYLAKGDNEHAIKSYEELLEKYEETRPLSSIRYKLGQIYFNKGEIQQAAKSWNEFKGTKSGFWKNLAQEQLKNSEWNEGYKKYIKRIPAMSEKETR